MTTTDHSAAPSLAGYLWQVVLAVCGLIERGEGAVDIEGRDDIVIVDQGGVRRTAIQAKHHFPDTDLALSGPDLWKTLHVWIDAEAERGGAHNEYVLVTTAGAGDLAPHLTDEGRVADVEAFSAVLNQVAETGRNAKLGKAYAAWKSLQPQRRLALLDKVRFAHGQRTITHAREAIDAAIDKTWVDKRGIAAVREGILAWVIDELFHQLKSPPVSLEYEELSKRVMGALASALPNSVLPNIPVTTPSIEAERATDPRYLKQLRLLGANQRRAVRAMGALYHAKIHRDEWLRSRLTSTISLERLDQGLRSRWSVVFDKAERDLGTGVHTDARQAGWAVHDACMEHTEPLDGRPCGTELVNGSFYLLSNRADDDDPLGWHPDFVNLLLRGGENGQ